MREQFRPDPTWSREKMETVQREIAESARFEDELGFDPPEVHCTPDGNPVPEPTGEPPTDATGEPPTDATGEPPTEPATTTKSNESRSPASDNHGRAGDGVAGPPVVIGLDQAFLDDRAVSAAVAIRGGEVIERVHATAPLDIPYIPGLLAFREGEAILRAIETLSVTPDLALFDGNGRIHFRQAGLATHVGVAIDVPAVGVAKNLLCGEPASSLEDLPAGARVPIEADGEIDAPPGTVVGYAYQTRQYDSPDRHVNPVFVSPGHRVSAETAVDLVERCCGGYKLPEPTRLADRYADEVRELPNGNA